MNTTHSHPVTVTRVADDRWQAAEADDQVVGYGEAWSRPDGRTFLGIESWHGDAFDQLLQAMPPALPRPLYTVVDAADPELTAGWQRAGFTAERTEHHYLVPTDPGVTGLGSVRPPSGVTVLAAGAAEEEPLRALDHAIRAEVEASVGWRTMPAEMVARPDGRTPLDLSKYVVAVVDGEYVGLLRLAPVPRQPRIGLIAVRAGQHRRGIARALLAQALGALHRAGVAAASAEVDESNRAAVALFEGIGARRMGSSLELVLR
ncbi:GNAT family N-acetyltransferase [Kitasatospora sp. NPDC002040]|uniref:GNAT family N-acetyltransferase n=1 Tax=Kitasatospora sp. NPDC002040 TaxID=3154661 RepID=UPI00331CA60C